MTEPVFLPLRRTRLVLVARGAGRFPAFPGSAWRGAFGHALKRTVCVMRLRPCAGCPLERSCIYPTVFEAAPGEAADRLRRLERVAQPYVLMPPPEGPRQLGTGDPIRLDVTLVGRAIAQRAYVWRALEAAARGGLGPDRVAFEIAEATELEPASLAEPPAAGRARLSFLTPVRLKRDGRLVPPAQLTPADVLMALVRRVSMLAAFHGPGPLGVDFRGLKWVADGLAWQATRLGWRDTVRHSARQEAVLRMGGLVGDALIDARALTPFRPFLRLAPWLGIGKGASMGLGQVALAAGDIAP